MKDPSDTLHILVILILIIENYKCFCNNDSIKNIKHFSVQQLEMDCKVKF